MRNQEQISVPLPAELREFVARVAERELVSQAAVVRRLVADAARQESREHAHGRQPTVEPSLWRPIELVPKSASEARVSEETWAKMSDAERMAYARRFPQPDDFRNR
jgi:hypothetical protein